jgi:ATP-dependent RNA helicase DDX41
MVDLDSYEPYIPVQQRRQARLSQLAATGLAPRRQARSYQQSDDERGDEEETRHEKERKERTLLLEAQEVHRKKAQEGEPWLNPHVPTDMLVDAKKSTAEKAEEAEAEILAAIANRRKLASDRELAKGIQYVESMGTSYVSRVVLHECSH